MINGINLNDQVQNQITFQPSINTVSGVQGRQLDAVSAEYGRSSGAVVNIATRSGTNDFHGEVFEFFRNESLDARNFFNAERQPQSPFKRNQFGANLGGPILKNRTFFFVSYEGLRQRQELDFNSGVLSDAAARGGHRPRGAEPAAADPGRRTRSGATRRAALRRHRHRAVDIDQWTGDVNHQLGDSRPAARLLRLPARRARRAEPAGQHHPRLRRHPHVEPPDRAP